MSASPLVASLKPQSLGECRRQFQKLQTEFIDKSGNKRRSLDRTCEETITALKKLLGQVLELGSKGRKLEKEIHAFWLLIDEQKAERKRGPGRLGGNSTTALHGRKRSKPAARKRRISIKLPGLGTTAPPPPKPRKKQS